MSYGEFSSHQENRVLRGSDGDCTTYRVLRLVVAPCLTVFIELELAVSYGEFRIRRVLRCVCIYLVAGYFATPCLTACVRIYLVAHLLHRVLRCTLV